MNDTTRTLPPHGTLSRHKYHKCKCDLCFENYRTYQRSRYRKRGYGTWQPYVDAEPIRQHLLELREHGIAFTKVAELAGLYPATVGGFLYPLGPNRPIKKRARPEIAAKILAITPASAGPRCIEALGTRRRLQALSAIGWPLKALAPHIGVVEPTVPRLIKQQRVFATTAEAVTQAYRQLRDQKPEDNGVPAGVALKTRNRATANGWPGPDYWDDADFDNPDFQPAVSDELSFIQLGRHRRNEIDHLDRCGIPEQEIAERLGMRRVYVHDIIRELRKERVAKPDLEQAA